MAHHREITTAIPVENSPGSIVTISNRGDAVMVSIDIKEPFVNLVILSDPERHTMIRALGGIPVDLTEYRITFGMQYDHEPHPQFSEAHPNGWLAILAPDELIARHAAIAALGTTWSSIYHPVDDGYPRGNGHDNYNRGELGYIEATDLGLTDAFIGEAVKLAEAAIAGQLRGDVS